MPGKLPCSCWLYNYSCTSTATAAGNEPKKMEVGKSGGLKRSFVRTNPINGSLTMAMAPCSVRLRSLLSLTPTVLVLLSVYVDPWLIAAQDEVRVFPWDYVGDGYTFIQRPPYFLWSQAQPWTLYDASLDGGRGGLPKGTFAAAKTMCMCALGDGVCGSFRSTNKKCCQSLHFGLSLFIPFMHFISKT